MQRRLGGGSAPTETRHRDAILSLLHHKPRLTRAEIAARLSLGRSTVSETLTRLLDQGAIVAETLPPANGRGRPAEVLTLDPQAGFYLGLELAHHRVTAAVTNACHEVIGLGHQACDTSLSWPERLQLAIKLAMTFTTAGQVSYDTLHGVAVGLPGPFSPQWSTGSGDAEVEGSGAFGSYEAMGELTYAQLEHKFRTDVLVDHHVRFAAEAEAEALDHRVSDLLYIRLSTGVGGAIISRGEIVSGHSGRAGEIGHVFVPESPDETCRCGNRGCLELITSVPAILSQARAQGLAVDTITDFAAAVAAGEPRAIHIRDTAVTALGRVMAHVAMTVDPAEIVLAGELPAALGDDLTIPLAAELAPYRLPGAPVPTVSTALRGDEAAALGAIARLRQTTKPFANSAITQPRKEFQP